MRFGFLQFLFIAFCALPAVYGDAISYKIAEQDGRWQVLKEGKPFYIKGAVGWKAYDMLHAYGANSVRIRANQHSLDKAKNHGFSALVNLPVRGERNGLDWGDEAMVDAQMNKVLDIVKKFKDHPAVMIWAVGNELDWIPPGVPHHPALWRRLNAIAREIKKIDPHHPVLTVVGSGRFEKKIHQIKQHCPDMDLLGINTYGDIAKVTALAREHWPKPYLIAEWGPTGHWQVPKTKWGVPIEQTSTQKAYVIHDRYKNIILQDRAHCLGSYVFYWAEKQETTHTWYGLFRGDKKTESIDVMKKMWSGTWPANRAPAVIDVAVQGDPGKDAVYLQAGEIYEAKVYCYDCDYDALQYTWDIRREVEIPKNSYAGGGEKPAKPIPGLIHAQEAGIRFTTPAQEGPYRLFVEITDGHNNAGYANIPFYVGKE